MELIKQRIDQRAAQALRCLVLNPRFYADVQKKGLKADCVFKQVEKYCISGESWFKNSNEVEAAFCWLIKIGVLRREVDGQGLTSKIRLTPLGRQILEKQPDLPTQKADFWERVHHWIYRNWPLR